MNREIKFIISVLFGALLIFAAMANYSLAVTPYYYTVSYATPDWGCGIKVSKINLDTKEVTDFDTAGLCYMIINPRPIVFTRNDSDYIFAATANCSWGKRVPASSDCYSDYVIYNDVGKIIHRGVLERKYVYCKERSLGSDVKIKYREYTDSLHYWRYGTINLQDDNTIILSPDTIPAGEDPTSSIISGFQYFKRIDKRNDSIYWDVGHNAVYLLRIDTDKKVLLDSLRIPDKRTHTCLFALSDDQRRIYTFHFFAQYGHKYYENGTPPILPSYIKVYRADTLVLIDSFAVPAPSAAKGYVAAEWASAERIDEYIIYYFFADEGIELFDPAMLYIFDTRNNESTWLNVGWR